MIEQRGSPRRFANLRLRIRAVVEATYFLASGIMPYVSNNCQRAATTVGYESTVTASSNPRRSDIGKPVSDSMRR